VNKVSRIVFVVIALFITASLSSSVFAQNGPYLQINNGDRISINRNEKPQIVLQFGAGQSRLDNAGILCVTLGGLKVKGQVYTHGAFSSFSIAPKLPGVALPKKAISFPSAFSFLGLADEFKDVKRGQNYNVAFSIDASGGDGQVLCALVDGAAVAEAAQSIGLGPANLTDQAVIELVASVALDLDALEVDVR
jgi:hypothetical protein